MDELAERFDLAGTSKSASKFDPAELTVLNRTLIHHMPFEEAKDRLRGDRRAGRQGRSLLARGARQSGHGRRRRRAGGGSFPPGRKAPPELSDEDRAFVRDAYDFLPLEPWDHGTWKAWTDRVKEATGRKGRALYMPLRLALTGLASGPELSDLLPLLGREGTLARRP